MTSLKSNIFNSLVAAVVLTFSSMSHAAIISSNDSVFGTDSITVDSTSGLDWLDVTLSLDRSYNDVDAQFGLGGDFAGWRYATGDEFVDLLINWSGTGTAGDYSQLTYTEGSDSIDGLITLLGDVIFNSAGGEDGLHVVSGLTSDTVALTFGSSTWEARITDYDESLATLDTSKAHNGGTGKNQNNATRGSFLVRTSVAAPVSEPSILALFGLGLLGFHLIRRRKNA